MAETVEARESRFRKDFEGRMTNVRGFLKQIHEIMAATAKEESLNMKLRDLEEDAKKADITYAGTGKQDEHVFLKMRRLKKEIEGLRNIEEERETRSSIEKISIADVVKKLQKLVKDVEEVGRQERALLGTEIRQLKDTMEEREFRLREEVATLKKERDGLFVKLTTLNVNQPEDKRELEQVLGGIKEMESGRLEAVESENQRLFELAQSLSLKLGDAEGQARVSEILSQKKQ